MFLNKPLRLGSIQYLNSLPVDLGFVKNIVPIKAEPFLGVPAVLNQELLEGRLDISPISAFWYAKNSEHLSLLPDLSISSESGVMSVLLFSRYPLRELAGRKVGVTSEGRTTPILFQILCQKFFQFKPLLSELSGDWRDFPKEHDAMLIIGDDALKMRERLKNAPGIYRIDLAEEWKRLTGMPFVFAVWAVRKDVLRESSEAVREVFESILASKRWGLSHLSEVIAEAQTKSGLSKQVLQEYFSSLSYNWSPELEKAVRYYFELAQEAGFLERMPEFSWAFPGAIQKA